MNEKYKLIESKFVHVDVHKHKTLKHTKYTYTECLFYLLILVLKEKLFYRYVSKTDVKR